MPENSSTQDNAKEAAISADLRRKTKGKAPESAGFDKKLDGPNRPST